MLTQNLQNSTRTSHSKIEKNGVTLLKMGKIVSFFLLFLLGVNSYAAGPSPYEWRRSSDGAGFATPNEACRSMAVAPIVLGQVVANGDGYDCYTYVPPPYGYGVPPGYPGSYVWRCGTPLLFFDDTRACEQIHQLPPEQTPPNEPKSNGPACCEQPRSGQPINPGTGNMWHVETDYQSAGNLGVSDILRTYNSSQFQSNADAVRAFGVRWTSRVDIALKVESPRSSTKCYRRDFTDDVWCRALATTAGTNKIPDSVSISRADGKKYFFSRQGSSWITDKDVNERLAATYTADGTDIVDWWYTSAMGDVVEHFSKEGALLSTKSRSGLLEQFTYSTGQSNDSNVSRFPSTAPICAHVQQGAAIPTRKLLCITNSSGRQISFEYDAKQRVSGVIGPENERYQYFYDGESGGCFTVPAVSRGCSANNLTRVIFPDGKGKRYFYNESSQINNGDACNGHPVGNGFGTLLNTLTGIQDENETRHINWTYDCFGNATSSDVAGVEKVSLAYGPFSTSGISTTSVTNAVGSITAPLTTIRTYQYQNVLGVSKVKAIDGPCVECGPAKTRIYDANGNATGSTDWNDAQTSSSYDLIRNLETSRTEAVGTPAARTTTTEWHPTYRLPQRIAKPKLLTTMKHDASGNVLTRVQQATSDANGSAGFNAMPVGPARTWTYTYNTLGQVLTAIGPRTDVVDRTKLTYDSMGNVATVTNPAGQVTNFTSYDANGRLLSMTDINGAVSTMTYSPRGWLLSSTVKSADTTDIESTTYTYDGVGQMKTATFRDGNVITYTYDNAHRLTAAADSIGNQIAYVLDNMGNRTSEVVTDPGGALVRATARVYDALSRLQQVTGGVQ